jgi:hypothetical protein
MRVTAATLLEDTAERARGQLIAQMIRDGESLSTIRAYIAKGWPDAEPLDGRTFDALREALLHKR